MATEVLRCHCSVSVQVDGKPLRSNKTARDFGLRAVKVPTGHVVQVLGFLREIRLTQRSFHSAAAEKISEGRLLIRTKENMQLMLTQAQPGQLQEILRMLSGAPRPVATPAKVARLEAVAEPTPKMCRPMLSEVCWQLVLQFLPPSRLLAEVCRDFKSQADHSASDFRLKANLGKSVAGQHVLQGIKRRNQISILELCGFDKMTASFCKELAEVPSLARLRGLSLRGVRGPSDVALQRLLRATPQLQHLDLLEVPGLSNRALQVALPALRTLLVGSLGSVGHLTRPETRTRSETFTVRGEVERVQRPCERPVTRSKFTEQLLQQLQAPELFGEAAAAGASPQVLVLAHCDVQVLPRLRAGLRHLDLRGAQLSLPAAAEQTWQPLRHCAQLEVLSLASNTELGARALRSCLESLPSQLKVLDLSDTQADEAVLQAVFTQQSLTHLRMCRNPAMDNHLLERVLLRLPNLEVLDVSGCRGLSLPFQPSTSNSALRLLCVAHTALQPEPLRRALLPVAPQAEVVPCLIDIFQGYQQVPPVLV